MSDDPAAELRSFVKALRRGPDAAAHTSLARLIAACGGDVSAELNAFRTGDDETLLHLSSSGERDVHIVRALLAAGADANARGHASGNRTPLHEAARIGRADVVRVLVEGGARVDARKSGDWTALMLSARNGRKEVVEVLCGAGASLVGVNAAGAGALYLAARSGGEKTVRAILECAKERGEVEEVIGARTRNGRTALHAAATADTPGVVRLLIDYGARAGDVDAGGMSALHEAAAGGCDAALEALVGTEEERTVAAQGDAGGFTALHHAAMGGHVQCVRMLGKGMLHSEDGTGYEAAERAVVNGRKEAAAVLCGMGGRVGERAMEVAERFGYGEVVEAVRKVD